MESEIRTPSLLVRFYLGTGTDARGRHIDEIWEWDDEELEFVHDYIQWLFPLQEPSAFNSRAPRLTAADITAFQRSGTLRAQLGKSYQRMLRFYGLRLEWVDGARVVPGPEFDRRKRGWLNPNNHNHLRLTRIMTSMATLGLSDEALALQAPLLDLAVQNPSAVTRQTVAYWRRAVLDTSGDDDHA